LVGKLPVILLNESEKNFLSSNVQFYFNVFIFFFLPILKINFFIREKKMNNLQTTDQAIYTLINQEQHRAEQEINLIASENYTPLAVLQATGSILTNKYAEGYPGKRYYAGCEIVDQVEQLAIDRCKTLFGAQHANVQSHAGSQANMAAYFAVLNPGDTILGMSLAEGGHLTHGHAVNFSGKFYKPVQYHVNRETELIDFDEIAKLAHEHKPKIIIAGASAYSRAIDFAQFAKIAREVGAYLLVDMAHIAGLIAAKLHPSPVEYADIITSTTHKTLRGPRGALILSTQQLAEQIDKAVMPGTQGGPFLHVIAAKAVSFKLAMEHDFIAYQQQVIANSQLMAQLLHERGYRIVAGGTDNHLFIVDMRSKKMTGKTATLALEKAGIIVTKSCVPFDPEKPWITSGIRIGTPAITTRGMKEKEVHLIVEYMDEALKNHDDAIKLAQIKQEVLKLCGKFRIYDF
jgi:glycine hydroxymethyltransferase